MKFDQPFFERGQYGKIKGTGNPWAGRPNAAPFDQPFYIILNVAVGAYAYAYALERLLTVWLACKRVASVMCVLRGDCPTEHNNRGPLSCTCCMYVCAWPGSTRRALSITPFIIFTYIYAPPSTPQAGCPTSLWTARTASPGPTRCVRPTTDRLKIGLPYFALGHPLIGGGYDRLITRHHHQPKISHLKKK